jgi:hypothetical protein
MIQAMGRYLCPFVNKNTAKQEGSYWKKVAHGINTRMKTSVKK